MNLTFSQASTLHQGALHLTLSAACGNQDFLLGENILGFQFHLETTPESAQALIDNCGSEIVESRFIQSAKEMLGDRDRFGVINQ